MHSHGLAHTELRLENVHISPIDRHIKVSIVILLKHYNYGIFLHPFSVFSVDYIFCLPDPLGGLMHLLCFKLTECHKDKPRILFLLLIWKLLWFHTMKWYIVIICLAIYMLNYKSRLESITRNSINVGKEK